MRCIGMALLLCISSPVIAADVARKSKISVAEQKLLDKWIVRSVTLDGKPTPAQIGQQVGDIITVQRKDHITVVT